MLYDILSCRYSSRRKMILNYTSVEYCLSSIPHVNNSRPRIIFHLDNESRKRFSWENADLNILSDGRIFLTKSEYDYSREEWHETILRDFKGDKYIIRTIDNMLSEEPCGPGGRPLFTSFASIVSYLTRRSSGSIVNG